MHCGYRPKQNKRRRGRRDDAYERLHMQMMAENDGHENSKEQESHSRLTAD
jgi:hypothetical protein